MHQPVHSDFIVHWTGKKDIDNRYDPKWRASSSSRKGRRVTKLYLERLWSILKYGLWMTKSKKDNYIILNNKRIRRPKVARTCFTELRISKAHTHAKKFGRLGIGFKRFFLLNRFGAPMIHYQPKRINMCFPPFVSWCDENNRNSYFPCFLKPMTETTKKRSPLKYAPLDESEWRIIYSEEMKERLKEAYKDKIIKSDATRFFKKPKQVQDKRFSDYLKRTGKEPEYLIPLNPGHWFAMVIYPSLAAKVEAEADKEIRALIKNLKPAKPLGLKLSKNADYEKFSKPMEIDLNACGNF